MLNAETKKREVSNPIIFVVLALVGIYFVYVFVSIPFRMGQTEGQIKAAYAVPKEDESAEEEVFNHRELIKPSEDLIKAGASLYKNNCASCHGPEGYGDGPSGQRLAKKPRDFHDLSGWLNGAKVVEMYDTLENGVGVGMAAFPTLNPRQKYAVIHYIHDEFMSEVGWPETTQADIDSLPEPSGAEQLSIDPYKEQRVPVRFAMMKLAENSVDNQPVTPKGHSSQIPGKELYMANCASCHGPNGEGIKVETPRTLAQLRELAWGSSLLKNDAEWAENYEAFKTIVVEGEPNGIKPGFPTLTRKEMQDLYGYVQALRDE